MISTPASPLHDPRLAPVLFGIYEQLDGACRTLCDLDLASYAALADIAASREGISTSVLRETYRFCDNGARFDHVLRDRELVSLVRFKKDRRVLAYRITPKGIERSILADQVLASSLITLEPGLTEESLNVLVDFFYDISAASGNRMPEGRLFPPVVLRALCDWRHAFTVSSARFGMTSAQAIILICAYVRQDGLDAGPSQFLQPSEASLEIQTLALRSRGFLENGRTPTCTDAGDQRATSLMQRLSLTLDPSISALSPAGRDAFAKLTQYLTYLFS